VTAAEIASVAVSAGLSELTPDASQQFATYLQLLLKWNARLNLTSVRDSQSIVRRHFLESIECAQLLPDVQTLLDYGSGAGIPGIPIAICRPEIAVTLGESQAKKAAFLREAVRTLQLKSEVFDGRIETMPENRLFDAVTLRAVDNMQSACREAVFRVKPKGWLVLFAAASAEDEHRKNLPEISWNPPIPVIESPGGILMLGRNVPRETK
jgi:16S rRNA (guanine527-N7)-methyltransferase